MNSGPPATTVADGGGGSAGNPPPMVAALPESQGSTGSGGNPGGNVNVPAGQTVSGPITVGDGTTLTGRGSIDGDLLVDAGGTLAPGASPGTLFVDGDVTLMGTLTEEINGANPIPEDVLSWDGYDVLVTSGKVTLLESSILDIVVYASYLPFLTENQEFTIISAAGGVFGTFGTVQDSVLLNGARYELPNWYFDVIYQSNAVVLVAHDPPMTNSESPLPEPGTLALIGLGLGGLALLRRRRPRA